MKVSLVQSTPDPVQTIAKIASIRYDSDPKNPARRGRYSDIDVCLTCTKEVCNGTRKCVKKRMGETP